MQSGDAQTRPTESPLVVSPAYQAALAELKAREKALAEAKSPLDKLNANAAFKRARKNLDDLAAEGPATPPHAGAATSDPKVRAYQSVSDMLKKLPNDLRQPVEGWDQFQLVKVQQWLKENAVGAELHASVSAHVERVAHDGRTHGKEWEVTLVFQPGESYFTTGHIGNQVEWNGGDKASLRDGTDLNMGGARPAACCSYSFTCNDVIAKEWDQKKQPFVIGISAPIDDIDLSGVREIAHRLPAKNSFPNDPWNFKWVKGQIYTLRLGDAVVTLPFRTSTQAPATPNNEAKKQ